MCAGTVRGQWGQLAPILGRVAGAHKSSARTEKLLLFICIFVSFFFFIGEKAKEWKISVLKPMGKPDLRVPWICLIMNDTDKRQMSVEPPPPAWRYSSRASAYKEAHSHENFGIFIETSRRNSCWRHEDGDSINVFTVNIQTGIDCLRVAYADTAFAFDSCTTERSMPEGGRGGSAGSKQVCNWVQAVHHVVLIYVSELLQGRSNPI